MALQTHEMPPIEYLRKFFRVDEQSRLQRWSPVHGWRLAARDRGGKGYFSLGIKNKQFLAHRVIWTLHYGVAPAGLIDHINGKPWDNRIENLREATPAENRWNSKANRRNGTGFSRVLKVDGGYRAKVCVNYKLHFSPPFNDPELAELAGQEMARKLHGEFAYENREAA